MHLTVAPATTHDVRRLVDIEFRAFENERTNQQLSYRDNAKPVHFERTVNLYTKALKHTSRCDVLPRAAVRLRVDSDLHHRVDTFLKVIDTDCGEILSFAKMDVEQYTHEELLQPASLKYEQEPKMNRDWFALNEQVRREYMGQAKHCCKLLSLQPWLRSRHLHPQQTSPC